MGEPEGVLNSNRSRHFPAQMYWLAFILLAATLGVRVFQYNYPPVLPDLVRWVVLSDSSREAAAQSKPILYVWTAEWCGACRLLQRELFTDPRNAGIVNDRFVPVRIYDSDESAMAEKLRRRSAIKAYPTLVIAAAGHEEWVRVGYGGIEGTMSFLMEKGREARDLMIASRTRPKPAKGGSRL